MKQTILYLREVSASLDSGMTLQILNDYGHLSRLGIKVHVPIFATSKEAQNKLQQFALDSQFENLVLFFLPPLHKKIRQLVLILKTLGIVARAYKDNDNKTTIVIREHKFLFTGRMLKYLFKSTLITELHEGGLPTTDSKQQRIKFHKLFHHVDGVIFTSNSQAEYLSTLGYKPPRNQIVLPNGVDAHQYSMAQAGGFDTSPIVLTYTGQFTSWKMCHCYLKH